MMYKQTSLTDLYKPRAAYYDNRHFELRMSLAFDSVGSACHQGLPISTEKCELGMTEVAFPQLEWKNQNGQGGDY